MNINIIKHNISSKELIKTYKECNSNLSKISNINLIKRMIRYKDPLLNTQTVFFKITCPIYMYFGLLENYPSYNFNNKVLNKIDIKLNCEVSGISHNQKNKIFEIYKMIQSYIDEYGYNEKHNVIPLGSVIDFHCSFNILTLLKLFKECEILNTNILHTREEEYIILEMYKLLKLEDSDIFNEENIAIRKQND